MNFENCIVLVLFTCFITTIFEDKVKKNADEIMKSASDDIDKTSDLFKTITNLVKNETISFDHAFDIRVWTIEEFYLQLSALGSSIFQLRELMASDYR